MKFMKKYWLVVLLLTLFPVGVIVCFLIKGSGLNSSDWLSFWGAVLAYAGTTLLSAVALYQSQNANELSERVYELSERAFLTIFSINSVKLVSIEKCNYEYGLEHNRIMDNRIMFCHVDTTPDSCQGYRIKIKNCSEYPITSVIVSTTYDIGRKRQKETLVKDVNCSIAPSDSHEFLLCNSPRFAKNGLHVQFNVSCKNIFGNIMKQRLEIEDDISGNELRYKCTILE